MATTPLAHLARPTEFDDFQGYDELTVRYPFLKDDKIPSIILFGPPGSGKTTLAKLIAGKLKIDFYSFNAVLSGVAELKKIMDTIVKFKKMGIESAIFIDEIHRFNKAQQDSLLSNVESGNFLLIGATTQNPYASINKALLSRMQIVELKNLTENDIKSILKRVALKFEISINDEILDLISFYASGDARRALNFLEIVKNYPDQPIKELMTVVSSGLDTDDHYEIISAFIKSLRGSDPDSALCYLNIMLENGEDPLFIVRRMIIFASEDVGNADIHALPLAIATYHAVNFIGLPEARINMAQLTTYLASTVKSNASYMALEEAKEYLGSHKVRIPQYLKNKTPESKDYKYPHDFPGHFVEQEYTIPKMPTFYKPTDFGNEKNIKERLKSLRSEKYNK